MSPPPSIAARFALIVAGVCATVAARGAARGPTPRLPAPFVVLVWGWLRRLSVRFGNLAARNGRPTRLPTSRLPTSRLPTSRQSAPRAAEETPRVRRARLPEGFAWLIRAIPEAAAYGGQLRHLLSDPDFAPLLAAEPGLGRVLRPLCRALGIPPGPARSAPPAPPTRPEPRPAPVGPAAGRSRTIPGLLPSPSFSA